MVPAVSPKMQSPIRFFASVLSLFAHTAFPYASLCAFPEMLPSVNPLDNRTHSSNFPSSKSPPAPRARSNPTTFVVIKNDRPCVELSYLDLFRAYHPSTSASSSAFPSPRASLAAASSVASVSVAYSSFARDGTARVVIGIATSVASARRRDVAVEEDAFAREGATASVAGADIVVVVVVVVAPKIDERVTDDRLLIHRHASTRAREGDMSSARAVREAMRRAASIGATASETATTTRASGIHQSFARSIGSRGVPDEYGQPATGGTSFLGTPKNHRELLEKRPMSPDGFAADGSWSPHYKFPAVALSSITNRVTGVALTGAMSAGGVIALVGGPEAVPMTIEMFKAHAPFAVMPAKFALSFPFVFHTLGGFRHLVWDTTTKGIDNESANTSSLVIFSASAAASAALAAYTW